MELSKPFVHLLDLDDVGFRRYFAKTPVRRAGYTRFLRNVLIAAGNSGDASLSAHVERHLSNTSPLVRGMAIWALRELLKDQDIDDARLREIDADVKAVVTKATEFAQTSPEPDPAELYTDVLLPLTDERLMPKV